MPSSFKIFLAVSPLIAALMSGDGINLQASEGGGSEQEPWSLPNHGRHRSLAHLLKEGDRVELEQLCKTDSDMDVAKTPCHRREKSKIILIGPAIYDQKTAEEKIAEEKIAQEKIDVEKIAD